MGYRKIPNLYKDIRIFDFKECYALEKIHGTSAHIQYKEEEGSIRYASGGEKHSKFVELFNENALLEKFKTLGCPEIIIYGEAYGGKQQGMRETYGDTLKFICFEVKIGDVWLNVPNAAGVVEQLGLEFVDWVKGPATLEWVDEQRTRSSIQAILNGCGGEKLREGVVLRPILEYRDYRGNRIITKHKNPEFGETKNPRKVDPERLKVLSDAAEVAEEWVTPMRLTHVLDKLKNPDDMSETGAVIKAMIEDVKLESEGEVIWSKPVEKAIGKVAAKMFKKSISKI